MSPPNVPAIRRPAGLACSLLALAAALRVPALRTDFWLDEIWSLEGFALRARSVAGLLVGDGFRHDNNHPLNTLWLFALGERSDWTLYRALAFVCGLASVGAAIALGRRRSRAAGLCAGALFAGSFLQVVYSTEARGYAPAVLFALLAALVLEEYLETRRRRFLPAFFGCVLFGTLAHPSFAHLYVGALPWTVARTLRTTSGTRARLVELLRLHAVPVVLQAAFFAWIVRGARIGGGPPWAWHEVADDALAWTLGYPIRTVPAALALGLVGALVLHELLRLRREGSDLWLLYSGVIVLAPALTLALLARPYLFARYFLIPLSFLLLLLAGALARLARVPRWGTLACLALLAAFGAGNLLHLAPFYDHGRGGARAAMDYVLEHSPPGEIVLTGAPVDLWTEAPAAFYARRLSPDRAVRYVERATARREGVPVQWFVEQSEARRPPTPDAEITLGGRRFGLAGTYPAYGPSGLHWFLYRRGG